MISSAARRGATACDLQVACRRKDDSPCALVMSLRGASLPQRSTRHIHMSIARRAAKPSKKSSSSVSKAPKIPEYRTPTMKAVQAPPRTPRQEPSNPLRHRRLPIILGSLTLLALSSYSAFLFTSYNRTPAATSSAAAQRDVSSRYDIIAKNFDESIDCSEKLMGLAKLRRRLALEARGDVCEVSIGTGRNLSYYDWDIKGVNGVGKIGSDNKIKRGQVTSFTAVDKSAEMVEVAKTKFPDIAGSIQWVVQDATLPLPGPNGDTRQKFDTIIQTMGLCSASDPVALLRNLGESVKPDTGRILLLEHGRGTWNWINSILDRSAQDHATKFGCWWNRDLGSIISESGLDVVKIERKHFGTTWWIELRPRGNA